jgi:hypothetical protein
MCDCGVCGILPIPIERAKALHRKVMSSVQKTLERAGAETYLAQEKPSVNATGDIVTFGTAEYRWRDGDVFRRIGEGNLHKLDWKLVPPAVRAALCECLPA